MLKLNSDNQIDQIIKQQNIQSKYNINGILKMAVDLKASDVHITVAAPPYVRINGKLVPMIKDTLRLEDSYDLVKQVLNESQFEYLRENGEIDLSYSVPDVGRFRVNAFKQRGSYCMVLRLISFQAPTMESLGLPENFKNLCALRRGLILVTGPTGSGKSTTLASMVSYMNKTRNDHIVTIEDPIEFLHKHGSCIVNQREVGIDTKSFANALKSSLREDPDIILVGEMRDQETIATAITAAETGHLVLTTLHTIGATKTIDRIVDSFPPHQQQQIKIQLAGMIEAVISQQLLPTIDGKSRVIALEVMTATPAIRNLIREGKTHQLQTILQTGSKYGMITMDKSIINLYRERKISMDTSIKFAVDQEYIMKELGV